MSKILFIGAHYDDIELSCGGTIVKMLEQGNEVMCLSFSDCGIKELAEECELSMEILGVKKVQLLYYQRRLFESFRQIILDELIKIRTSFNPDMVFTHSATDRHQDHATVGAESLRAFRNYTLITYTAPWNKADGRLDNYYVQLTDEQVCHKWRALQCYKSQSERIYMADTGTPAMFTGGIVSVEFAESFYIERKIES